MNVSSALSGDLSRRVEQMAGRYSVTPRFLQSYLDTRPHVRAPFELATDDADFFERLGPLTAMYVRYALTTTERGRTFLRFVSEYAGKPRRFLDVGCAYGGFLRAFREAGAEVVGVEKLAALSRLAEDNIHDVGGKVVEADILTTPAEALGHFDLIACNDVIEHVAAPELLVRQVASLLSSEGRAYFEIPNPEAIAFVTRDGHFQQFGITLLPRDLAAQAVQQAIGKSYDDMGTMHEEATYREWFQRAGLEPAVDVAQVHAQPFDQVHQRVFDLVNAFTWWFDHERLALPPQVGDAIVDRYWRYAARMFRDLERARQGDRRIDFERRYLTPFWTFLLGKSRAAPS